MENSIETTLGFMVDVSAKVAEPGRNQYRSLGASSEPYSKLLQRGYIRI